MSYVIIDEEMDQIATSFNIDAAPQVTWINFEIHESARGNWTQLDSGQPPVVFNDKTKASEACEIIRDLIREEFELAPDDDTYINMKSIEEVKTIYQYMLSRSE